MSEIQTHVSAVVEALLSALEALPPERIAPAVHAQLWPYVESAVAASLAGRDRPAARTTPDRRSRPWQYVARFWTGAGELSAETDPATMQGTGGVPGIIRALAAELHGDNPVSPALDEDALKAKLPQVRNNLGRAESTVLRIPYQVQENGAIVDYLCQFEIYRLP